MKGDVIMEFETIKGGKNMNNDSVNKEEKTQEGKKEIKEGLKILAVVGIGAGLYGFKLGRKSGYRDGVKDGHVRAVADMIDAWKGHTEILLRNRGE